MSWRSLPIAGWLAGVLMMHAANADQLAIEVTGVDTPAANNIRAELDGGWVSGGMLTSERR